MSPLWQAQAVAAVTLAGMSAYALLSGADFGGGIWDLLARPTARGAAARELIDQVITPVWEANHVWLIFVLVLVWTAFSPAFAAIMTTLFVPLSLSLLGIFFRGIGFSFRHGIPSRRLQRITGAMFAASSLLTPFFLGTVIGAIATGSVHAPSRGDNLEAWTSPTALLTGGLFVTTCAYVGAIYLVGDARRRNPRLRSYFARRATIAGVVAGIVAAATLGELSTSAPHLFHRLTGRALPLVAASVVAGIAALVMIQLGRTRGLRIIAAVAVTTVIWGWGWAQYPQLLPGSLSLARGSAPPATLDALLAVGGLALALVAPAFALLLWLQQRDSLGEPVDPSILRHALDDQEP